MRDNRARVSGGGIELEFSRVFLVGSRVSGNVARHKGGGISNWWGEVTLTSSTITGNTGRRGGGGIYNDLDEDYGDGITTLDADSSVTGNTPDDCVGTPAC